MSTHTLTVERDTTSRPHCWCWKWIHPHVHTLLVVEKRIHPEFNTLLVVEKDTPLCPHTH
jgi:hypothetical protein